MKYLHRVVQSGETINLLMKPHWMIYAGPLVLMGLGITVLPFAYAAGLSPPGVAMWMISAVTIPLGLGGLPFHWLTRVTTEYAVTSDRIIIKSGWIRRATREFSVSRVESVDLIQSVLGRILNYGTISVRGVGTAFEPFHLVPNPPLFRKHVLAAGIHSRAAERAVSMTRTG